MTLSASLSLFSPLNLQIDERFNVLQITQIGQFQTRKPPAPFKVLPVGCSKLLALLCNNHITCTRIINVVYYVCQRLADTKDTIVYPKCNKVHGTRCQIMSTVHPCTRIVCISSQLTERGGVSAVLYSGAATPPLT